jgi:hypothetical protein
MPSRTYDTSVIDVRQFAIADSSAPSTVEYYANGLPISSPVIAAQYESSVERVLFAKCNPFTYAPTYGAAAGRLIVFIGEQLGSALWAKDSTDYNFRVNLLWQSIVADFDITAITWNNQSVSLGNTAPYDNHGRFTYANVGGFSMDVETGSSSSGSSWMISAALRNGVAPYTETIHGYKLSLTALIDGSYVKPSGECRLTLGNEDSYTGTHVRKRSYFHLLKSTYTP